MTTRGRRSTVVGAAVLVTAVVVLVVLGGPTNVDPEGPGGTAAVRELLRSYGVRVVDGADPPPPPGVFVLLHDLRDRPQATELLSWVEAGGTLVITDPVSETARRAGVEGAAPLAVFDDTTELAADCVVAEVSGAARIAPRSGDRVITTVQADAVECFRHGDGAYLLVRRRGAGRVLVFGGRSWLTNELLGRVDHAGVALRTFATGGVVVFGPPLPPGAVESAPRGLLATLPDGGRVTATALLTGALVFALARARRLGRAPDEVPLSPVPGSALVSATAGLYREARASSHAGELMRDATRGRLRRRMGLETASGDDALVRAVAAATGTQAARVAETLQGAPVTDDDALIALGRSLHDLEAGVAG